jgi:SAM-dependent methyltransferase
MTDPTKRFSSRVGNYIRYRPNYPNALVDLLQKECGLCATSLVADVGSGTGILTELFLKNGNVVYGIEPNFEMRTAGELLLQRYQGFHSVAGIAEATTLPPASVDFITAGQAFHWFDRGRARIEFRRILKSHGWVVLVWNDRRIDATLFLEDYERLLLKYAIDYQAVNHKNINRDVIASFFGSEKFKLATFENRQVLNFDGLKGRLLSSSYVPAAGQPNYEAMLNDLHSLFGRHQVEQAVKIDYETLMYYGQFPDPIR